MYLFFGGGGGVGLRDWSEQFFRGGGGGGDGGEWLRLEPKQNARLSNEVKYKNSNIYTMKGTWYYRSNFVYCRVNALLILD